MTEMAMLTSDKDADRDVAAMRTSTSGSIRLRLLTVMLVGLSMALMLAGWVLSSLFRDHVMQQFEAQLTHQLDQITTRLGTDAEGKAQIDPTSLSDPRWSQPYSGLYWQVDAVGQGGQRRIGDLRSRSLWDETLALPSDWVADGAIHVHEIPGPESHRLLALERTVRLDEQPGTSWRLIVAADLGETHAAIIGFNQVLAASLFALLLLLVLAGWAQLSFGLRPLQVLQQHLRDLQAGRVVRLGGRYPSEVQPLVDDFNHVLDQNQAVVERARTQAGNLAHALKTPLTVLEQGAFGATKAGEPSSALANLVREQVAIARRQVDWHLARSRAAAARQMPGLRTDVLSVVNGLVRLMKRVHAERDLSITVLPGWHNTQYLFAGEEQDLQEMLGNLIDNACKWASSRVTIEMVMDASAAAPVLEIRVCDDGPGIVVAQRDAVMVRGARLDESVPGSGLGLAIVQEIADLYGGSLTLKDACSQAQAGLQTILRLPAARSD